MAKIVAHCLVKNEDRFIWYSLNSVLPYVDLIMIYDTGSTDNTLKIIKQINSPKILLKEVGDVDQYSFTQVRNQMLKASPKDTDWIMILDGDEIWPNTAIAEATNFARHNLACESIVVRTNNLVGDIYHRSPDWQGQYHLAGRTGHLNLRFMNVKQIPGLNVDKPHGQQGYFDKYHTLVQDRAKDKVIFLDVAYSHATHLQRSTHRQKDLEVMKREKKYKYEFGYTIPSQEMPEIFFNPRPKLVEDVTSRASLLYFTWSLCLTVPKYLKRLFLPTHHGY